MNNLVLPLVKQDFNLILMLPANSSHLIFKKHTHSKLKTLNINIYIGPLLIFLKFQNLGVVKKIKVAQEGILR